MRCGAPGLGDPLFAPMAREVALGEATQRAGHLRGRAVHRMHEEGGLSSELWGLSPAVGGWWMMKSARVHPDDLGKLAQHMDGEGITPQSGRPFGHARRGRPAQRTEGLRCILRVHQGEDGGALSAHVAQGSGNAAFDHSAGEAVLRASPLPIPSHREVFEPILVITFAPPG